jgi:hypothetical protein
LHRFLLIPSFLSDIPTSAMMLSLTTATFYLSTG